MNNTIIETKLIPPRYHGRLVHRERLLKRLRGSRKKPITLVIGAAGYGKTTLVTLWRQELISQGHDIAWLSLTPEDDDLNLFVTYLANSLNYSVPGIANEAITLFDRGRSDTTDSFLIGLINNIKNHRRDLYLILDDYHLIKSVKIHLLLEQLMLMAPANFHLVIASRAKLPLSVARFRAHNLITEIDFAELRLTYDEASEFVSFQNVNIQDKDLRVVYELVDGWISGLQLICIILKRNPDMKSAVVSRFRPATHFSDYLDSEVLRFLSEDELGFLTRISVCRKFCSELAEEVTGSSSAGEYLKKAEEDNLFLIPLETGDGQQWFRFHPLMSQQLKQRLGRLPVEEIRLMNTRASEWYIRHDVVDEAVHHAIYGEYFDLAADLLGRCGRQMVQFGQLKTLLAWYQKIPEANTEQQLEMQLAVVWALLVCSRTEQAVALIEKIKLDESSLPRHRQVELKMQECTRLINADDTAGLLSIVESTKDVKDDSFLLGCMANVSSVAYCHAAEYEKARDVQLATRKLGSGDNQLIRSLFGACFVGQSFSLQGNMVQAERTYRDALMIAEKQEGFYSDPACIAISFLSEVLYETGQWCECRELLLSRLDIIDRVAPPDGLIRSYMSLAMMSRFAGHVNEANYYLETLEDIGLTHGLDRLVAYALYGGLCTALQAGSFTRVDELLRRLNKLAEEYTGAKFCAYAEILWLADYANIRYAYANKNWDEALTGVERLSEIMTTNRRLQEVARLKLLNAKILNKQNKQLEAIALTEQCLGMSQQLGLVHTVLDEGLGAQFLIERLQANDGIDPLLDGYIKQLSWNKGQISKQNEDREQAKSEKLIESLSERESEILALLAKSLTNKKVALSLGVSPETIKWHLKNIYGKLGVISRDEAVARGRDLNLIG